MQSIFCTHPKQNIHAKYHIFQATTDFRCVSTIFSDGHFLWLYILKESQESFANFNYCQSSRKRWNTKNIHTPHLQKMVNFCHSNEYTKIIVLVDSIGRNWNPQRIFQNYIYKLPQSELTVELICNFSYGMENIANFVVVFSSLTLKSTHKSFAPMFFCCCKWLCVSANVNDHETIHWTEKSYFFYA